MIEKNNKTTTPAKKTTLATTKTPAQSTTNKPTAKTATKGVVSNSNNAYKPAKTQQVASSTQKPVQTKKQETKQPAKTKNKAKKSRLSEKGKETLILFATGFIVIVVIFGLVMGLKPVRDANQPYNPNNPAGIIIPVPENGVYNLGGELKPTDPYQEVKLGKENFYNEDQITKYNYDTQYTNTSMVGFSGRVIGEVERNIPEKTRDEGLGVYPKYGYTLSTVIGSSNENIAARNALIAESNYFCANGTHNNSGNGGGYTWMDKDGYLYTGTTAEPVPALDKNDKHRRLYKHSASVGLYMGDVSNDEPGIIKEVTIRPRKYNSYSVTGVYAPAGEIIKIQISEEDMNATGGLTIHIGQALYNGQANNIWTAKGQMQRFPIILNTMNVNKNTATLENGVYTAYVGSFVGGPLYIRNTKDTFTATISGGVSYSHFILGSTSKEEFEQNNKSSAPYFDLEVWNYGVLHSGPKAYARNFSYDDLYKAAVLWEKVSSVTTTGSSQGVVFLYDPFVAAGAAVAFPGRSSVNCPAGWMASSLNYNAIVTSGSWGNFHEYHHNFQNYGVGNGGEVTNNGMTLVSYALFTKISSARGISGYGSAGLGGWNSYTSATWALSEVLKIPKGQTPSNGNQGLTLYSTLLHNFGADNYIQAKFRQQSQSYGQSYSGYLRAWQDITHNDMTYFFKDILKGIDEATANKWKQEAVGYPTFVPVSSVYQTGRSYMYDGSKKYFQTMQPYVIPYTNEFIIDLSRYTVSSGGQYQSGSVVLPDEFEYTITNVSQPTNGTIEKIDDYHYKFKPNNNANSGKIIATLKLTSNVYSFEVDDIDLVLEFQQSHETNKTTLERTTYSYSADNMYLDAQTAYENNFQGYEEVKQIEHSNPVQNCNTDIWYYLDTQENHNNHPNSPEHHFLKDNSVVELKGKLYFNEAGKYRIYLRGRKNCAVYYSTDNGQTYKLGASVTNGSGSSFYPNNPSTYFDVELEENSWVYFKSVLIVQTSSASFIGLGYSKWQEPMFTIVNKYYDRNGNEVSSAEEAYRTETHYYDYQGNEVSEAEANRAELIPPASNRQPSYINAYREDYEFASNSSFETDYFYTREYKYTYGVSYNDLNQSVVGNPQCPSNFPIENLFDNDLTTSCSSPATVSATKPWELTVDLGEIIEANRMVLTGRLNNGASNQNQTPNSFTLYLGETLQSMQEIATIENGKVSGITMQLDFERTSFRYYKLIIRKTVQGRFAAIANVEFSDNIANGEQYTLDNEMFTFNGTWQGKQTHSSFGHVYVGSQGSKLTFNFTGTRLALLSSSAYGKNFEVYIDGVKANSIRLKQDNSQIVASYISNELANTTHRVEIRCLGEANIDSVAVFK